MANDLQTKLDAIKLDKDTNLLPENLKAGITCLGVTGTLTAGEDLQEQLNAQDLIIQQLQEEIANKASAGAQLNLYQQLEEPEGKDGIWVKTDESFKNIIADKFLTNFPSLNLIDLEENTEVKLLNEIPVTTHTATVQYGDKLYFFPAHPSNIVYLYDLLTGNVSTKVLSSSATRLPVLVNDKIYLLGISNSLLLDADTLDEVATLNSYSALSTFDSYASFHLFYSDKHKNIYGYSGATALTIVKYEIETNTWSTLASNLSYKSSQGANGFVKGDKLFITGGDYYGGTDDHRSIYSYNISSGYFGREIMASDGINLSSFNDWCHCSIVYNNSALLFDHNNQIHRIDFNENDEVVEISVISNCTGSTRIGAFYNIGMTGYFIGADNKISFKLSSSMNLEKNSVYINVALPYKYTQLLPNIKFGFREIYLINSGGNIDTTTKVYYGDGKQWIKIGGAE